jgi:hypothetical protein
VLAADPKKGFEVEHDHKYFSNKASKNELIDESKDNQVIYTGPGQARVIELVDLGNQDQRAGLFPQHNSVGDFPEDFAINPSLQLNKYQGLSTSQLLEDNGFFEDKATMTKKKLSQIQNQFANLSPLCFEEMMCISSDAKQRDFNVWAKFDDNETTVAYINPNLEIVQFFQTYIKDEFGQIVDVRHVVCETGMPIVINQTMIDEFGNHRNIAHVGVTGSKKNSFYNSLERFDDGSLVWTSSDFKFGRNLTGSAVIRDDGSIELLEGSDLQMAEFSARNLGAEAIDPKTLKWKGKYSKEGCIREEDDKYVTRREYKAQVRTKVNQIIDGACIPGLTPIFTVNI